MLPAGPREPHGASRPAPFVGSVPTYIDDRGDHNPARRLERAGYVRRVRDDVDRRRVLVELTDEARRRSWEIWGPIAEASTARLGRHSNEELLFIRDFLSSSREFLLEQLERVKTLPPTPASPSGHRKKD